MPRKNPYVVRELPWTRGTRRRLIERCCFFHEAQRIAEGVSAEGRQVAVELHGMTVALWLNGARVESR